MAQVSTKDVLPSHVWDYPVTTNVKEVGTYTIPGSQAHS